MCSPPKNISVRPDDFWKYWTKCHALKLKQLPIKPLKFHLQLSSRTSNITDPSVFFLNSLLRTLCEYPSTLLAKFKGGTPKERKFIALQSREIVQRFVRKGARTCPHHTNVCNNSRHCEAISTLGTTGIFSRATRSFVGRRPTLLLPKAERGSLFKT